MATSPSIPPGIKIKFKRKRDGSILSREGEEGRDSPAPKRQSIEDESRSPNPNLNPNPNSNPSPNYPNPRTSSPFEEPSSMEPDGFSGKGVRISEFPVVVKTREAGRPHSSVLAVIAADRAVYTSEFLDDRVKSSVPSLENISHGQVQVLSAMSEDQDGLYTAASSSSGGMIEVKGVFKSFKVKEGLEHEEEDGGSLFVFPMHADWFSLKSVHRMERQVVPEYFRGNSSDRTPKAYMELRNTIVKKYLENPERALSVTDFQGLSNIDTKDLTRIFEFLELWGIINYSATSDLRSRGITGGKMKEILLENANSELQIAPGSLKSISSLISFEAPRTKLRPDDVSFFSGCSGGVISDLDRRIQERLLEHRCSSCSKYCSENFYQSQKETDIIMCSECFNDGKPVIGVATVDFVRMDSSKETGDADGNNWTDEETLLLLEALEIYKDNWNEIAEHVGTKSKAQCILHFIRLPMEDGLLDNIDVPDTMSHDPDETVGTAKESSLDAKCNGISGESENEDRIIFSNSPNPVMALVAFLASAIGPRVAAACARAILVSLSKDECNTQEVGDNVSSKEGCALGNRLTSENKLREDGKQEAALNSFPNKERELDESQTKNDTSNGASVLPPEKIKMACMVGLSAAALKAKLFADQEEREIQRLAISIVSQQLRRVEIKLKQFLEIETLLSKECEQVERTRQRLSQERIRLMSSHFNAGGSSAMVAGPVSVVSAPNNRPAVQPSIPSSSHPSYGPTSHPAMPFMPRPSMFSFGAGGVGSSVPLSAMQSLSGGAPGSIMMGPSTANSNVAHNMLRPVTGTNTSAN